MYYVPRLNRLVAVAALSAVVIVGASGVILSLSVATRRGVDGRVTEIRIPLYLKLLSYLDRHLQYRRLARRLVGGLPDHESRIMALFEWTRAHVRPTPDGFPVVDDHVWDIIVRGYGSSDQAADVFATLCAYAGIPAHFRFACAPQTSDCIGVAFVQLPGGGFGVFDPRHGVAVRGPAGGFATIAEIETDPSLVERAVPGLTDQGYAKYFRDLPEVGVDDASRTSLQMPLKRLWFMIAGRG